MFFYDTCSLMNEYNDIFNNIHSNPFVISNVTLKELKEIKDSKKKDERAKAKAQNVIGLLKYYYGKYTIANYNKDWDSTYIDPNPILVKDNDARIAITALNYSDKYPDTIFVTDDNSLHNIAKNLGLTTKFLTKDVDNYTGYITLQCVNDDELAVTYDKIYSGETFGLIPNQYLIIKQNNEIIDSYVLRDDKLETVQFSTLKSKMFGEIKPLDPYQKLAIHSLKENTITMLRGHAGSGKSYLALGCLFSFLDCNKIDKIIIFCNTVATKGSAKLGYYPGERTEKLLDSQIGNFLNAKFGDRSQVERMIEDNKLLLLPISDIRGYDTTGMRAGVYITEAQNLDIELMKLALQRIGDDAICILDGDSDTQVDLDCYAGVNNGMKRASKTFRGSDFYGEVTLPVCHRSKIAALAEKM